MIRYNFILNIIESKKKEERDKIALFRPYTTIQPHVRVHIGLALSFPPIKFFYQKKSHLNQNFLTRGTMYPHVPQARAWPNSNYPPISHQNLYFLPKLLPFNPTVQHRQTKQQ